MVVKINVQFCMLYVQPTFMRTVNIQILKMYLYVHVLAEPTNTAVYADYSVL